MLAEWTGAFEEDVEDEFWVWEVGAFGLGWGNAAGIGGASFAHRRNPGIVATSIVFSVSRCWTSACRRWVREVLVEHGDEVVRDGLAQPAVEGERLEHFDAMFEEEFFIVQGLPGCDSGDGLRDCLRFVEIEVGEIMEDGCPSILFVPRLASKSCFGVCLAVRCLRRLPPNGSK